MRINKQITNRRLCLAIAGVLLASGMLAFARSGSPQDVAIATEPLKITGTYRLVSRDLPDGTTMRPPHIHGMYTLTEEHRNFNVYWRDEEGRRVSIGIISRYTLTEDEYRETNVYYVENNEIAGTGVRYNLESETGRASVIRRDGRIEFDLPLHGEPRLVFTKDGFTASRKGEFVDHWQRVK